MKEKRYFCDCGSNKSIILVVIIFSIVVTIICSLIYQNIMVHNHSEEVEAYSESAYEYLDEIADNVIGKAGINMDAIPEDVAEYEITYKDDKIIFKYSLDNNTENGIASTYPSMTVTLSKDFEVLSKKPYYSSNEEKEFLKNCKIAICIFCIVFGSVILIMSVATVISKKHKERDMKNLS